MDTASSITHFTSFLAREGYPVTETTSHFVTFEAKDRTFVIALSDDDPNYFRLILPNFVTIDGSLDRDRVDAIASQVTAEIKVVKVFAVKDKVWATVEMLVESPEQTGSMFSRMLDLLAAGADLFTSRFSTEDTAGDAATV
ncbi:MAG: hypothetical protein AAF602_10975 [Myxococcota bacterium]